MYWFLLIMQIVVVLTGLAFIAVVSGQRSKTLVMIMLNIGYCAAIMNVGYLMELCAKSEDSALTAMRFEYLGGAFVCTYLFIFICRYCRVHIPDTIKYGLYGLGYLMIAAVWTSSHHDLIYGNIDFVNSGVAPHLVLEYGTLYKLFKMLRFFELLACLLISVRSIIKAKDKWMRHNYFLISFGIMVAVVYPLLFTGQQYDGYNAFPCGIGLGTIVFGAAITIRHVFDMVDVGHSAVINNMDTGIIVVNSQKEFEEANPRALELFPYLVRFAPGTNLQDTDFGELFEQKETREFVIGDSIFDVHVDDIWNQGEIVGKTAAFIDVTQRKRELEERRELQEEAEVANQAKSRFLANMSHEIRTPINAILGMNEMILREGKQESVKHYAMDVKTSATSLLAIVNDVLDFSKIESGKMEIIPVEYELCSMLNDLVNMINVRAAAKNLQFDIQVSPTLPSVLYGDDIRIREILINLLTNAVKYTETGTVTLRVSGKKEGHTVHLHFEVEDTGIGISKEELPKLYTAFERIDEKRNRSIEGTGLGMNITLNLLQLMGSKLQVESEYGKGSIFSFDLSQRIVEQDEIGDFEGKIENQEYEIKDNLYVAPEAKILVVDDNMFNRNVFRQLLKRTRIQVVDLGSGQECLEQIQKEHFDMIFLDHMMPKMDGVETFLNMQQMEHLCKDTPVVMLTANAIKGAREQYLEYGFDSFLSKPVDPDRLEKLIWEKLPQELLQIVEPGQEELWEDTVQSKEETEVDLPELEGVDWRHGGLFFPNSQDLLEAATDYAKSLEREDRIIEEAYEILCGSKELTPEAAEALDTYRIHVHSMKSSSAMVGNLTLSALAKCLEAMAKKQDVEGIMQHHSLFREALQSSKEEFSVFLPQQEEEKESISKESLLPMLELMEFHVRELDVDSADDLMQVLDGYSYEMPVWTYMEKLKEAVENIDTEGALEAISEIREWGNNHG